MGASDYEICCIKLQTLTVYISIYQTLHGKVHFFLFLLIRRDFLKFRVSRQNEGTWQKSLPRERGKDSVAAVALVVPVWEQRRIENMGRQLWQWLYAILPWKCRFWTAKIQWKWHTNSNDTHQKRMHLSWTEWHLHVCVCICTREIYILLATHRMPAIALPANALDKYRSARHLLDLLIKSMAEFQCLSCN